MKQVGKLEEIYETLPQGGLVFKTQTGFNFHYQGKVYAFHYNNDPWKENKCVMNGKVKPFLSTKEAEVIEKFAEAPVIPPVLSGTAKVMPNDRGTKACIDHIQKKIEVIEKINRPGSNQQISLLKNLINELQQFL